MEEIFRGRLGELGGEVVSRRVFESVRVDEGVEVAEWGGWLRRFWMRFVGRGMR